MPTSKIKLIESMVMDKPSRAIVLADDYLDRREITGELRLRGRFARKLAIARLGCQNLYDPETPAIVREGQGARLRLEDFAE